MNTFKDLTGIKFGRLTPIRRINKNDRRITTWECLCDCGKKKKITISNLQNGHVKSCGCLIKETHYRTHGMTKTHFYRIWIDMVRRISNKKHSAYFQYGGRGIKLLWKNFENFKKDMYDKYLLHVQKYGESNTTIERKNVNGNYSKENCCWATKQEQQRNRRDSLYFTVNGVRKHLDDWSKEFNINRYTLYDRLKIRLPATERPNSEKILKELFRNE